MKQSESIIQRLRRAWNSDLRDMALILFLIALVSLGALALLQSEVSEVLVTVSHSV